MFVFLTNKGFVRGITPVMVVLVVVVVVVVVIEVVVMVSLK